MFLPEDLKSFFMTSDGFQLTWCVKIESKSLLYYRFDFIDHYTFFGKVHVLNTNTANYCLSININFHILFFNNSSDFPASMAFEYFSVTLCINNLHFS